MQCFIQQWLPTLWQQFGESSFLFQHDIAPSHQVYVQKFAEFEVEEVDSPAQSSDFNLIQNLWDELVIVSQALLPNISCQVPKSYGKPYCNV